MGVSKLAETTAGSDAMLRYPLATEPAGILAFGLAAAEVLDML